MKQKAAFGKSAEYDENDDNNDGNDDGNEKSIYVYFFCINGFLQAIFVSSS